MTPLLEDRVCAFIADHPDVSFTEIQRAIPCLSKTLAGILESPLFEQRNGQYRIAGTTGKRAPRPRVPQANRMLGLLRRGGWVTIGELWDVGVGRPNSRATDLRKRGYVIEHRHDRSQTVPSRVHQYRLVELLDSDTGPPVSESSGPAPAAPPASAEGQAARNDGQLVLSGSAFRRGGS